MSRSPLSDLQWRKIHERVLAGERVGDLDKELGFSNGVVRKMMIRRFGYQGTNRPAISWDESDEILARVHAGESVHAIARSMSGRYDTSNLYRLLNRRYGYDEIHPRQVWAPTVDLTKARQTDLAYTAAIVDGEGSIIKDLRTRKVPTWILKVAMTDEPVMEWLHSWGGTLGSVKPRKAHYKPVWAWRLCRQIDVHLMLSGIEPYMIVKRALARHALAELDAVGPANCDWTPDEHEEIERRRRQRFIDERRRPGSGV